MTAFSIPDLPDDAGERQAVLEQMARQLVKALGTVSARMLAAAIDEELEETP